MILLATLLEFLLRKLSSGWISENLIFLRQLCVTEHLVANWPIFMLLSTHIELEPAENLIIYQLILHYFINISSSSTIMLIYFGSVYYLCMTHKMSGVSQLIE